MDKNFQLAIQDTCIYLDGVFHSILKQDGYSDEFKFRPEFADYRKFYLNKVQGSHDTSLYLAIHYYLHHKGHFKKLLSKKTYESQSAFMEDNPNHMYIFEDNIEERDLVDALEFYPLNYVKWLFENYNLDEYASEFEDVTDLEPDLNDITRGTYIFDLYTLKPIKKLRNDIKEYSKENDLSEDQKELIVEVCNKNYDKMNASNILNMIDKS